MSEMSVQLLSPVSNHYTIYYSTYVYAGVRCVVCMWWEGEGGGSHFRSPLSKSHLLILSWREGAQPIINDRETILVVHKFNTRGLALKLSILISLLCVIHRKNIKNNKTLFQWNILNFSHFFLFNNSLEPTN